MAQLSPSEIYQYARNAGFPPDTAIKMTAIALKESLGNTDAFNGNASTGDKSYGLTQVNMIGDLGAARLKQFGLSDPSQLLDPSTNMSAAFQIWAGNDNNLNAAWYINKPGESARYQSFLPTAQAAADAVEGGNAINATTGGTGLDSIFSATTFGTDLLGNPNWLVIGIGLGAMAWLLGGNGGKRGRR